MKVRLPATLTQNGKPGMVDLEVPQAATLRSVLDQVDAQVPGAMKRILDGDGRLYRYVNIYLNGADVRHGDGLDAQVREGDEVLILPAISGG
jgi:molybdopterin converting factor small subunit